MPSNTGDKERGMLKRQMQTLGGRVWLQVLAVCLVAFALATLAACGDGSGNDSQTLEPVSSDELAQIEQALGALYPDFTMLTSLGVRDDVYSVLAARTDADQFLVKCELKKGGEWDTSIEVDGIEWGSTSRSTEIEGVLWSTSTALNQATDDLSLVEFHSDLAQSVLSDAALGFAEDTGSYRAVVGWVVISNMVQELLVEDESGQLSTYTYEMDIFQTPHAWVLTDKSENVATTGGDGEDATGSGDVPPMTEAEMLESITLGLADSVEVEIISYKNFGGWAAVTYATREQSATGVIEMTGQSIFEYAAFEYGGVAMNEPDWSLYVGAAGTNEGLTAFDQAQLDDLASSGVPKDVIDWLKDPTD